MSSKSLKACFLAVFCLLLASALAALCIGEKSFSLTELFTLFLEKKPSFDGMILLDVRLPRILAALFVGAALSVSGVLYQGVLSNALISPGILGVLSGASFGAALAMVLRLNELGIESVCFIGGILAMLLSLGLNAVYSRGKSTLMLILCGMIVSSIFGAGLSLLKLQADPYNTLPSIVYWLMGSLANVSYPLTLASFFMFFIIFLASLFLSKGLDILNLGDEEAQNLGINPNKFRILAVILATILASSSVALGGLIGWVGLIIPHISRFIVGSSHFKVLVFSACFGAVFLLFCDTLARMLLQTEIPIGILTSLISVPIFAFILWLRRTC